MLIVSNSEKVNSFLAIQEDFMVSEEVIAPLPVMEKA